jgi:1-deoxy-D-xylulose-5-phosphate synthase
VPDRVAWFMGKLLEKIRSPRDLRQLSRPELDSLCEEMREAIIQTVSDNGGHLASNLGVVELTVALGLVFSPPEDALVWDVGHQSYPYKLLTGRYNEFSTLRREGGLSGFPNRDESPCDSFTSGHSSASISSALGLSEACRLQSKDGYVVAVIGDGALTGGLSFEGLNNAGQHRRNLIVILNDNTMSISKNVGSLARYLTYMRTKPGYIKAKSSVEDALGHLPLVGKPIARLMRRVKSNIKKILYNSTIFSDLGFAYYGPFDGHNIKELSETFEAAKLVRKPVLIHVRTYKGKGYQYAEQSPTLYHGISSFDVDTGDPGEKAQSFSDVFGQTLCQLAREDNRICAITAAMAEGTGLAGFRQQFKGRFYDVGIAEEHAVTFSGGLAVGGMLPVFAVYSTFLQRSYDQLIHDVAMQKIKILLAIDRAGIVGEDGMTHQGLFDVAFLRTVPGVTLYSPTYFQELREQLAYLAKGGNGICAVRYPRGRELYKPSYFNSEIEPFSVYGPPKAETCIVTYGRLFSFAAEAADKLKIRGTDVKLLKLNRVIPIECAAAREVISCRQVFFFEEGIRQGGAGEHFASLLLEEGFAGKYVLRAIDKPFVKHAPMFRALETLGLNAGGIMKTVLEHFREEEDRLAEKEA